MCPEIFFNSIKLKMANLRPLRENSITRAVCCLYNIGTHPCSQNGFLGSASVCVSQMDFWALLVCVCSKWISGLC